MGYMVGRSTSSDLAARHSTEPAVQRNDTTSAMGKPAQGTPEKPMEVPQVTKSDAPAESTPTPGAAASSAAQSVPVNSAPTQAAATTDRKPLEVSPVTTSVVQPIPGTTYVQVTAPMRPEGELIVEVLSKKGFHAILAPGPDEKRFRVLVGPMTDNSEISKAITDLEKLGFKGAFPRHY